MPLFSGYPSYLQAMLVADPDNSGNFHQWVGSVPRGGSRAITYSISTTASTEMEQTIERILLEVSSFVNVTFIRVADQPELTNTSNYPENPYQFSDSDPDLRFSYQTDGSREGGFGAFYYWIDGAGGMVDIDSFLQIWSDNSVTIIHELGHVLGLKHTSPIQEPSQLPFLDPVYQNHNYTVMHYVVDAPGFNPFNAADGEWLYEHFQLLDVYALQQRFGVNTTTYAGSTTHTASSLGIDQWLQVLWDASGNDTIDMSTQTRSQRIDIRSGGFSNIGGVAGNNPSGYNLAVALGAQIENATGGSGNDTIFGNDFGNVLTGNNGTDIIYGNEGNDVLNGGDGNDVLVGGIGNDTLAGGTGSNEMIGNGGDDIYVVSAATTAEAVQNALIESSGEGADEVRASLGVFSLEWFGASELERLTFTDNGNHGAGIGNALDNIITGGTGIDELFGRAGNDTLIGGAGSANALHGQEGDDIYLVQAVGDSVVEVAGQGIDRVEASVATYVLAANVESLTFAGANTDRIGVGNSIGNIIRGLGGADSLDGAGGDDILVGGSSSDILQGGSGVDQFRYEGGESGIDRILDFVSGTDKIALRSSFFTPTATVAFVTGTTATTANSTIIYNPTNGIVYYDDDGTGAGAAVALAQINLGQSFSSGDFVFY